MSQAKVWKTEEYFVYFLFFKLHDWGKRFAAQPQTIYSEVPQEPKTDRKKHFGREKRKTFPMRKV